MQAIIIAGKDVPDALAYMAAQTDWYRLSTLTYRTADGKRARALVGVDCFLAAKGTEVRLVGDFFARRMVDSRMLLRVARRHGYAIVKEV